MMRRSILCYAAATAKDPNNTTLHTLRTRDLTLRVPSKDRCSRVVFASTRGILAETIDRHDLIASTDGHVPFLRLAGSLFTLANILASLQDGEERVDLRFTGDEATIVAEALALGECRAYPRPTFNAQLVEQHQMPPFPLKVDRVLYNQTQPFSSMLTANFSEILTSEASKVIAEKETGRRLAEAYLAGGIEVMRGIWKNTGGGGEVGTDLLPPPPYALQLPTAEIERLVDFFTYNLTLHGYNFFRRSDGCVAALGLSTAIDAELLKAIPVKPSTAEGAEEEAEGRRARLDAVRAAAPLSYGFLVQPLAAGPAVDWGLWKLQRAMAAAEAASFGPGGSPTRGVLAPLHRRALSEHTACQDTLSLVTGDYEGAFEAAVVARQYTADPAAVAAIVEPLRTKLGIADVKIALDGKEANRTGLDFFCRCSTAGILESLVSLPEETLQPLMVENDFRCTFCGKTHRAQPKEWAYLFKVRAERQAAGGGGAPSSE